MLHTVLAILKIIGIVLAAILGLFILILALALFVPVRYKMYADYEKKLNGWVRINWFLHLLSVRIVFVDNQPDYRIKILGIRLRLGKDPKEKKKKKKKEKRQEPEENVDDFIQYIEDVKEEEKQEENSEQKEESSETPHEEKVKKKKFFTKLRETFKKIKNIKYTILRFCDRISEIKEKASDFFSFLQDESNKAAYQFLKEQLKHLWKHIKPKKIRGNLAFGTGDPASTGQLLGILSFLYPVYRDNITIAPDFEEAKIEADLFIKGYIRAFPVLIHLFKLYRNKDIKNLLNNFRK